MTLSRSTPVDAGPPSPRAVRVRARVEGIVQGVGFRPFVYRLAQAAGLAGWVGNDPAGVTVEVEGPEPSVFAFLDAMGRPPPLAAISQIKLSTLDPTGETGFRIAASRQGGGAEALVSPDVATCGACLEELADPADRRFGYAFTNCTDCGPRFSIVRAVPYDRDRTTMAEFRMCPACRAEYEDPSDRRFHAEPVCCPACGPRLHFISSDGVEPGGDPLAEGARALVSGRLLAVKGLGGYHLAALAGDEQAVSTLRARKIREEKPFAVMAADVGQARRLCELAAAEEALLTDPARPIVLLRRRPGARVAPSVAPGNRWLGVMLPYTPLHHLLLRRVRQPIVLTSGNRSDEPIAYDDADALARLGGIADAFLTHDRPIHIRTDDSVARVVSGAPMLVRRSRGYAPRPLHLPVAAQQPVLATGAQLKNTFCLARGDHAFISHHIGDLEDPATYESFRTGIEHFAGLFDIRPEVVAHDLHPEYLSTKYALDLPDLEVVGVQHHHAHIASCLADNGVTGPVIGVAFDGFGWGDDGTLWGGEILLADLISYQRVGGLADVALPGGAAAVREPWRMAVAYLDAAFGGRIPPGLGVIRRHADRWEAVRGLSRSPGCLRTSSAGRMFDAVAAVTGVRDNVTYEGQAAIALEQAVDPTERDAYPVALQSDGSRIVLSGADLVRAVADDVLAGVGTPRVAARFHNGLADGVVALCGAAASRAGRDTVALSGGVFQNLALLSRVTAGLSRAGLCVLTHRQVPPNDGGISFGQAAVAAATGRGATCARSCIP